jgi:hypothetical protein
MGDLVSVLHISGEVISDLHRSGKGLSAFRLICSQSCPAGTGVFYLAYAAVGGGCKSAPSPTSDSGEVLSDLHSSPTQQSLSTQQRGFNTLHSNSVRKKSPKV